MFQQTFSVPALAKLDFLAVTAPATEKRGLIARISGAVATVVQRVRSGPTKPAARRAAFTIAVVSLSAKMAKADGVPLEVEAATFERLFGVSAQDKPHVRRVFTLASQNTAGYEHYAARISRMLDGEPALKRAVLECLFHIAAADGVLHPAEDRFLRSVADIFGFAEQEYCCVRRGFFTDAASPYQVLGVDPAISDEDLKARYRQLAREHHPDKLVASGVPPEFLVAADRRFARINAAYENIQKERGRKKPAQSSEPVSEPAA